MGRRGGQTAPPTSLEHVTYAADAAESSAQSTPTILKRRLHRRRDGTRDGNLPFYLAHRLSHWLWENAHLRLLCVVPICKDGDTVELHAWYEQHLFPDSSPLAQQQPGGESGE
jgi:hypothetical protein